MDGVHEFAELADRDPSLRQDFVGDAFFGEARFSWHTLVLTHER